MDKQPSLSLSCKLTAMAGVAAILPLMPTEAPAQTASAGNLSALAKREMIRRQNDVAEADVLFAEGREAYTAGDYQMAVDKFTSALQKVPDAPLFYDRRKSFTEHLTKSRIALSMLYREKGRLDEAETLLQDILDTNPSDPDALREMAHLKDPVRTNVALTPEYVENVAEVNELLVMADGHYNLGKYDDAKRAYEKILGIDPYNVTARRGLERVAAIKADYYRSAYDHTRIELLQQVDAAWEIAVPDETPIIPGDFNDDTEPQFGVAYITEKLRNIIIPSINFEDTTVEDAIEFLRQRAAELDKMELDPNKKGVNFVLRTPEQAGGAAADDGLADALGGAGGLGGTDPGSLRIEELRVRNVPLEVALKYICDATKLRYKIDNYAVTLVPQTETGEDLFSRSFTVPPNFRQAIANGEGGGAAEVDPFAPVPAGGGSAIDALPPVLESLKKSGISFPEGASATLTGNKLLVFNTPTELDKVEVLVDTLRQQQPKQVKITTKFVEVSQENGEELGFDWVVGPFFSGDGNLAGAGGTIGNGGTRTGIDFSGPLVNGVPPSDTNVNNIVTAGNRSGDFAIVGNSIDAILNNPSRATQASRVAPGIMSLTGLFSDGQLKLIMRGLSQKKGVDLMTAPSITARSGEKATIEIIREFIYPTEYDPPELQQGGGNNQFGGGGGGGGGIGGAAVQAFPVVPANPTAFETRNTGVTLEIEPTIGENDFMINLRFVPEIVEFEGFINYGSPIQTAGTDGLGNPVTVVITENRIEMPVFATRRVNSALTIYDGYTVAIGGLMREDVQNVEDKVPVLGDIPLIGRLFQTKAEHRIKSNLIIFVKAQIIDPTGRPIRDREGIPDDTTTMGGVADTEMQR